MRETQPKTIFPALTGVRAIAAFLVYLHHMEPRHRGELSGFVSQIFREMHVGVTVFFVLSGFLITYNYYESSRIDRKWLSVYFWNRFVRIFPVYLLVFLGQEILLDTYTHNIWFWILNLTLFKGFFDQIHFSGVSQAWSLTVEETFYFFAPLVFLLVRRVNRGFILPLALAFLFFQGLGFSLYSASNYFHWEPFFGTTRHLLFYSFFGRCFEFLLGAYLALLWVKNSKQPSADPINPQGNTITGILGFLITLYWMSTYQDAVTAGALAPFGLFLNTFLISSFAGLLLFGLVTEETGVRKILSGRIFILLGQSSYAFYLIHDGWFFEWTYHKLGQSEVLTFFTLILCSIALYKFFEVPVNKLLRKPNKAFA